MYIEKGQYCFSKQKQSSICIYVNKFNFINCHTLYTVIETRFSSWCSNFVLCSRSRVVIIIVQDTIRFSFVALTAYSIEYMRVCLCVRACKSSYVFVINQFIYNIINSSFPRARYSSAVSLMNAYGYGKIDVWMTIEIVGILCDGMLKKRKQYDRNGEIWDCAMGVRVIENSSEQ